MKVEGSIIRSIFTAPYFDKFSVLNKVSACRGMTNMANYVFTLY